MGFQHCVPSNPTSPDDYDNNTRTKVDAFTAVRLSFFIVAGSFLIRYKPVRSPWSVLQSTPAFSETRTVHATAAVGETTAVRCERCESFQL